MEKIIKAFEIRITTTYPNGTQDTETYVSSSPKSFLTQVLGILKEFIL